MQKITSCLWFADQAEEAAHFYTTVFKNSKIKAITRYGDAVAAVAGRPVGSVLTVVFEINGQEFIALNGGPAFQFTEAVSLIVHCKTQHELDEIWHKLSAHKAAEQCGWLKDKYGLSWQIVPTILSEIMQDKDQKRFDRVMEAVLQMKKLDINKLKQAYEQGR